MRKAIFTALLALLVLTACENNNSVNILIANHSQRVLYNQQVTVQLAEIHQWLGITNSDTVILLNEKNEPLPYSYKDGHNAISFVVPVIQARSQKNFSINKSAIHLSQNFLAFRRKSIDVTIE